MALDRRGHLRPVQCQEFWWLRRCVSPLIEMTLDALNHDLPKGPLHGRQFLRPGRLSIRLVELRHFGVGKFQPTISRRAAANVVEIALVESQMLEVFDPRRLRETPNLGDELALLQRLDFTIPGHESLAVHRHLHDASHGDFALASGYDASHRLAHLQLLEVDIAQGDSRPEKGKWIGNRGRDYQGAEYRRYLKHRTLRADRDMAIHVPLNTLHGRDAISKDRQISSEFWQE